MAALVEGKPDGGTPLFEEPDTADHELDLTDTVGTAHDHLLQNINKLDAKQAGRSIIQRSEPSANISEFDTSAVGGAKVDVNDLLASLGDVARHATLRKEVKRASGQPKLPAPLEKPQAVKLQRVAGYEKVKKEAARWESVVKQQRRAEHVSFPLQKPELRVETAAERTAAFVPRTPLEQEIAALLGRSSSVVPSGQVLSERERRALAAMSLDEALERRRQLAKHRALITYQEAKQRRQNKIKSRKYHRILKKERIKQHLKDFEQLKICNPEAALAKLQEMERDRAEERMSQKHKNTGKWARMQALKRKYDASAREALAENLRISREKTQKPPQLAEGASAGEESSDEDEYPEPEVPAATESDNPWLSGEVPPARDAVSAYSGEYTKFWSEQQAAKRRLREAEKSEEQSKEQGTKDDGGQEVSVASAELTAHEDSDLEEMAVGEEREVEVVKPKVVKKKKKGLKGKADTGETTKGKKKKKANNSASRKRAKDIDEIFDNFEREVAKKTAKKLKHLTGDGKQSSKDKKKSKKSATNAKRPRAGSDDEAVSAQPEHPVENMDESVTRKATMEDLEQLGSADKAAPSVPASDLVTPQGGPREKTASDTPQLDPTQFLTVEPRRLHSLRPQADAGGGDEAMEDGDELRITVAEAFADDDVVAEFRAEKETTIDADKPKDIDMALPGWGEWGGEGLKVSAKKRRRLMFRAPKGPPRKDHTLGHVILSEKRSEAMRSHQVNELPHYVKSVAAFEASIRTPLGRTWLPAAAHQKLTTPAVSTKAGTIIAPMDETVLLNTNTAARKTKRRRRKGV